MSFVTAAPDLLEAAAQDLAGIRSSLMEASASVAVPTTGVVPAAADEVSAGVAALFGNFGKEFQALSAQAQAFHAEFVNAMNAGAAAYASTEAANAGQALLGGGVLGNIGQNISGAVAGGEAAVGQLAGQVGASLTGAFSGAIAGAPAAAPTLIQGINSFGASVAAPYQALVANTVTNLQGINSTFTANPFPFLNQVASNQIGFAQTFGAGLVTSLQGFPANVPANIQLAIQGAMTFNPAALAQGFITQQQVYAQTISSSLQLAAQEFATGAQTFTPAFREAFQALLAGNNVGAYQIINSALINAFLPGFTATEVAPGISGLGNFIVTPLGPLGALGPIFTIPGQMAQNFTNLLPPGSILEQMAQNGTNVVDALTNFNTELDILSLTTANLSFGAPVQLIFGLLGAPGNALSALNSSGVALAGAVQAGNASAAAAAILDAPANMANGFLNGTTVVTLPPTALTILGLPTVSTVSLPLGGLLTPLSFPSAVANVDDGLLILPVDIVGGTPVGGLIPGLLSVDSQLAQAITPIT
jgi:hypothetical protein